MRVDGFTKRQIWFLSRELGVKRQDLELLSRRDVYGEDGVIDTLLDVCCEGVDDPGRRSQRRAAMAGEILEILEHQRYRICGVVPIAAVVAGLIVLPLTIWGIFTLARIIIDKNRY